MWYQLRYIFQVWLTVVFLFVNVSSKPKKNVREKLTGPSPITRFYPGGQYIVLTFENSPHATITPKILDILKEKNVHATFFINGRKAIYQKHLIKRMIDDGHEVANYGAHDKNASITNYQQLRNIENIQFTSKLIYSFTNTHTSFYRPPITPLTGTTTNLPEDYTSAISYATNLTVVMYSIDLSHATAPLPVSTLHTLVESKPGDIINLLDTSIHTVVFLPTLIYLLQNQNYEFLTLSQISSFPDDKPH